MKLACNYSPALMELLDRGEAPIDYIKAGAYGLFLPELSGMRRFRPVLLHGLGNMERAGMPDYESLDFGRMNRLIDAYGSPHLAIHLAVTNADAGPDGSCGDVALRMAACARHFRNKLSVPLLLENTGDTPEERTVYDLIPFVEPERIERLLVETGAGLLLDITHAKVTAQYRGWDIKDYLMELPLEKVKEIHITGAGVDADGAPYDAHGPMGEEDFDLLEWALGHALPDIVTLEYGCPKGFDGPEADIAILSRQLHRIKGIIGPAIHPE